VVHGEDGLDEITTTDKTRVSELKDGKVNTYSISPEELGLVKAKKEDLVGGNAEENAKITIGILEGEKGPKRDIVLLNAAAALVAGDKAGDFPEGLKKASEAIDSGAARDKLEEVKKVSVELYRT
jgi:anthranilate phosphoribosyltransferase